MRYLVFLACSVLLLVGCTSSSSVDADTDDVPAPTTSAPSEEPVPSTPRPAANTPLPAATAGATESPSAAADTTGPITSSDVLPSLDELRDLGLSDAEALCFTETIDPEGTGRVTSVDLFAEALTECL